MNAKTLKILSFVVTIMGFGIQMIGSLIAKKEMDNIIAAKVAEALSKGIGS